MARFVYKSPLSLPRDVRMDEARTPTSALIRLGIDSGLGAVLR